MTRVNIKAMTNEDVQNESRTFVSSLNTTRANSFVPSVYFKTYHLPIQKTYNWNRLFSKLNLKKIKKYTYHRHKAATFSL